jgi:hypothetical protein
MESVLLVIPSRFLNKEGEMKKLLTLLVTLASFAFFVPGMESETTKAAALGKPQIRIEVGQRRRHRRYENRGERIGYGQVYTQTRLVQRGWHTYRETYQIRTFGNGQSQTTLISRVRVN